MSSTTTKTSGNGVAAINKHVPAQREHGRDRLREEECYYLSGLIKECLDEAGHLVRKANSKAFNRTLDYDGTKGTAPLDRAEIRRIFDEAHECTRAALSYLWEAANAMRDQDEDQESPF